MDCFGLSLVVLSVPKKNRYMEQNENNQIYKQIERHMQPQRNLKYCQEEAF